MALDFGKKPEQQFREELRILATQIETINQQLAGGSGSSGGPSQAKAFQDMNAKLVFIYEFLKTMQHELKEEQKSSNAEVQKNVTGTLQKNLPDIYAQLTEMNKALKMTPQGNAADVADIKATLKELVKVYKEEVVVFRQQNQFLQNKLVEIESRLSKIEK